MELEKELLEQAIYELTDSPEEFEELCYNLDL